MNEMPDNLHQIPDLEILKVLEKMRRASLIYLENELRDEIKRAKNGSQETEREFLKKELNRLINKKLIGEIESHNDALRAYYLKADGLEEYCYLKTEEEKTAKENVLVSAVN